MLAIGQQDAVNILRFFDDLPDPRSKVNRLHERGQNPGGVLGDFCASWLRFSKNGPSKSLIP